MRGPPPAASESGRDCLRWPRSLASHAHLDGTRSVLAPLYRFGRRQGSARRHPEARGCSPAERIRADPARRGPRRRPGGRGGSGHAGVVDRGARPTGAQDLSRRSSTRSTRRVADDKLRARAEIIAAFEWRLDAPGATGSPSLATSNIGASRRRQPRPATLQIPALIPARALKRLDVDGLGPLRPGLGVE